MTFLNVANQHDHKFKEHEEAGNFLNDFAKQSSRKWLKDQTTDIENVA